MQNLLLCVHALCMNYENNTLLLVSSSVRSKQLLCFVHGQGQKSEQKPTTKSFDEFHDHSPLLCTEVFKIGFFLKQKKRDVSKYLDGIFRDIKTILGSI